jgi:hypothetical protein
MSPRLRPAAVITRSDRHKRRHKKAARIFRSARLGPVEPTALSTICAADIPDNFLSVIRCGNTRELVGAVVGLSAEERAQVRERLLTLLAGETSPWMAWEFAEAVARLDPTVADLRASDSWPFPPTPALLAAVRKNSGLPAWLTLLPLLSRGTHS